VSCSLQASSGCATLLDICTSFVASLIVRHISRCLQTSSRLCDKARRQELVNSKMSNLSPFENLGVDVLTIICEKLVYLPNKERVNPSKPIPDGLFRDNRDDLFSLSLTSRACRDVVLSVLWAKISLVASFDHRLTRKLVDVIVNKAPEIGGLIRTLHLKDPPEGCSSFVEKCDGLFEKLPNLRELV
jgi:hypothetical protein